MSRRESRPVPQEPIGTTTGSTSTSGSVVGKAGKVPKKPARESKIFQPSNFASRKAQADLDNAKRAERRLVSLGPSDFPQENLRTGEIEYLEVEIFTDLDHPSDRWVKFPGPESGLVPLQDHLGNKDEVVRHALKRPLGRPQVSAHNETQLDGTPPRKL